MGLISRVSSRTYREIERTRFFPKIFAHVKLRGLVFSNFLRKIWRREIDPTYQLRTATGSYTQINNSSNLDQDKLIRKLKYEIEQLKQNQNKKSQLQIDYDDLLKENTKLKKERTELKD